MTRIDVAELFTRREEAWRRRDPARLTADYLDTAIVLSPIFGQVQGRAAIETSYRSLFEIFPDWDLRGEAPIVEDTKVAQHIRVAATHRNELFGIRGTGKKIEFEGVLLFQVNGGQIAYERRIYDFSGVLLQIGVLRARPAKG